MKKKLSYTEILKETAILTVAVAIIAAAVYFFLVPSHASVSSISGLGIVLSKVLYITVTENEYNRYELIHKWLASVTYDETVNFYVHLCSHTKT